jgi:hypothetical protein
MLPVSQMTSVSIDLTGKSRFRDGIKIGPDQSSKSGRLLSVDFGDLETAVDGPGRELSGLAAGVFALEGLLRAGKLRSPIKVDARLSFQPPGGTAALEDILGGLIQFTLAADVEVHITTVPGKASQVSPPEEAPTGPGVLLFSGGTDSLAGLSLGATRRMGVVPFFVAHGSGLTGLVNTLRSGILSSELSNLRIARIQRRGELQQTRGFLYVLLAAVVGRSIGQGRVIVSESGPTMYLPPIAPLDEVTLTTNPVVLNLAQQASTACLGWDFEIQTPFANMTKAESIAGITWPNLVRATNSCARTRFASSSTSHCGTCFGCLTRRVSCLVAGVRDAAYAYDPLFASPRRQSPTSWIPQAMPSPETLAEVYAFAQFSRMLLGKSLDSASRANLEMFQKTKLLDRFALDILTALHLGYGHHGFGRNPIMEEFYNGCARDGLISSKIAEERLDAVRHHSPRPALDPV